MPYRDLLNRIASGMGPATTAGATSTDSLDTGMVNPGVGDPKYMEVMVTTAASAASSITFVLQSSPDNSNWTDILTSNAVPLATCVAGYTKKIPLPPDCARYVRAKLVAGTANDVNGRYDVYVTIDQ